MCVCDMTHSYVWHDSFIYVTWLIQLMPLLLTGVFAACRGVFAARRFKKMCGCAWHNSVLCAKWLIWLTHLLDASSSWGVFAGYRPTNSSCLATCPIFTCDMTHSYMWHDSFTWRLFFFGSVCGIRVHEHHFSCIWRSVQRYREREREREKSKLNITKKGSNRFSKSAFLAWRSVQREKEREREREGEREKFKFKIITKRWFKKTCCLTYGGLYT